MPTDPLVGTYCGDNTPGDFTSTTNRLYIKFSTDDDVAGAGFSVNYRTVASKSNNNMLLTSGLCCLSGCTCPI